MSRHKREGIVFSTNPDFGYSDTQPIEEPETLAPAAQRLRVRMERKGRGGKTVTVVDGFVGTASDLRALERTLKSRLAVGGSSADGQIVLQGDITERVRTALRAAGYGVK